MGKILVIKGADFSGVKVDTVEIKTDKVAINVVASPAGSGVTTGSGSYDVGEEVNISALPNSHYNFVQWLDGGTNPYRTIEVGNNAETYTAQFEAVNDISGEVKSGQFYFPVSGYSRIKVTYYGVTAVGTSSSAGKSAIRQSPTKPYASPQDTVMLVSDFNAVGGMTVKEFDLQNTTTYPYLAVWVSYIDYYAIVVEVVS